MILIYYLLSAALINIINYITKLKAFILIIIITALNIKKVINIIYIKIWLALLILISTFIRFTFLSSSNKL